MAANAGVAPSSLDDVSGLIPKTRASLAVNTHGMRGPRVHDDVNVSLVNLFYSDHARVGVRWIGGQGRILRPCVTLFYHRSVQRLVVRRAARRTSTGTAPMARGLLFICCQTAETTKSFVFVDADRTRLLDR